MTGAAQTAPRQRQGLKTQLQLPGDGSLLSHRALAAGVVWRTLDFNQSEPNSWLLWLLQQSLTQLVFTGAYCHSQGSLAKNPALRRHPPNMATTASP